VPSIAIDRSCHVGPESSFQAYQSKKTLRVNPIDLLLCSLSIIGDGAASDLYVPMHVLKLSLSRRGLLLVTLGRAHMVYDT
jgi:hypothetical protein